MNTINKSLFTIGVAIITTVSVLSLQSCGTDFLDDPAGSCVTCMATSGETIEACADGNGNLTVTTNGANPQTSERFLADFRIAQESTGSTCN